MKIDDVINALTLMKEQHGNLHVELLENTKYGCLPKDKYNISVCNIDGRKFVDISDVWEADE